MESTTNVTYLVAFASGLAMFLSPCILPLIPTYISYLTGVSYKDLQGEITPEEKRRIRKLTLIHSLLFIVGFSVVFILLGATVTFLGKTLWKYQDILKKTGAVLIIFFGLMITGVLRIGLLQKEKKIEYRKKGISYVGSFFVGATFALAWTPCVGPMLGAILVYASSTADIGLGLRLLSVFSMGMAVPFLLSALFINSFLLYFNKIKKYIKWVNIVAGTILIIFGALILLGGIR